MGGVRGYTLFRSGISDAPVREPDPRPPRGSTSEGRKCRSSGALKLRGWVFSSGCRSGILMVAGRGWGVSAGCRDGLRQILVVPYCHGMDPPRPNSNDRSGGGLWHYNRECQSVVRMLGPADGPPAGFPPGSPPRPRRRRHKTAPRGFGPRGGITPGPPQTGGPARPHHLAPGPRLLGDVETGGSPRTPGRPRIPGRPHRRGLAAHRDGPSFLQPSLPVRPRPGHRGAQATPGWRPTATPPRGPTPSGRSGPTTAVPADVES